MGAWVHGSGMIGKGGRLARLVHLRQAHLDHRECAGCIKVMQPSSAQMTSHQRQP